MKRIKRVGALFSGVMVAASLTVPVAGATGVFSPKADYAKVVKEHLAAFSGTKEYTYEKMVDETYYVRVPYDDCYDIWQPDGAPYHMCIPREKEEERHRDVLRTYEQEVPLCPLTDTVGIPQLADVERNNRAECKKSRDAIIKTASGDQWSPQMEEIAKLTKNNDAALVLQAKRKELFETLEKTENYDSAWVEKARALAKVYPQANDLLSARSQKLAKEWQGKKWSVTMENALAPLAPSDAAAKKVLTAAQNAFLTEIKNSGEKWSQPLDDALTTINQSPSSVDHNAVIKQLRALRDDYVDQFKYWGWSEDLELKLKPLTEKDVASAKKLLQDKRNEYASADLEAPLTGDSDSRLATVGKYDGAIAKKHDQKRWALLDKNKDAAWSRTLDDEVSSLAKTWEPAADFMTSKRQAALNPWRDKGWTRDMDKALAPLAEVYQPAADVLQEKRDIFITTAAGKDFAEVEDDVTYLAEEKGFAPAAQLAQKRREEKGDATSPDNNGGGTTGGTEAEEQPVDFDKIAAMTFEEVRELGPAARKHIVEAALKEGRPLKDFETVARVYISDAKENPLDTEALENTKKLADLGVAGAQKAYTINALAIAGTVLGTVAAIIGAVSQAWPQIQSWLRSVGVKI